MIQKDKSKVLICDIGGTNVRFGLYSKNGPRFIDFARKYKCVDFSSFEEAVGKYLKEKKIHPVLCVIGVAGNMNETEDEITETNTPWKASIPKLKAQFPFLNMSEWLMILLFKDGLYRN